MATALASAAPPNLCTTTDCWEGMSLGGDSDKKSGPGERAA
jgi:hypothetical protein